MTYIHIKCITLIMCRERIANIACPKLKQHLFNCMALIGLIWISEYKADGYDIGYFKKGTELNIDIAIKLLLNKIRPQAIPLVENVYTLPDGFLVSAIGNKYGDIYETHFDWATNSRMNQTEGNIIPGFKELITPIL